MKFIIIKQQNTSHHQTDDKCARLENELNCRRSHKLNPINKLDKVKFNLNNTYVHIE